MERDLRFIGYVDVHTTESEHQKIANQAASSTVSNLDSNMFTINLSNKVTKKNSTMYLAVFSVPITDDKISKGEIQRK